MIIHTTKNPFLVFTSNIFPIMGLRSLFIILSKAASDLVYIEPCVAIVLGFIGCKMIVESYFNIHLPVYITLTVILSMLSCGCVLSICCKGADDNDDKEENALLNEDEVKLFNIETAVRERDLNKDGNVEKTDSDHDTSSVSEDEVILQI